MTEADDRTLLAAAGDGDAEAFRHFVARHQDAAYRLIGAIASSPDDAEDALQEAFVSAWRNAASFRGTGSARGWILTIARNTARRLHRRRAGEPPVFDDLEILGWLAGWGDPGAYLERHARRDLLERAFDELDPDDREVLVLRELEGLTGEEVAGALGLTVAAMKSRLHRARLRLVAALRRVDR